MIVILCINVKYSNFERKILEKTHQKTVKKYSKISE